MYGIFSANKRLCTDTTSERPDPFEAFLAVEPIARVAGERFDPIAWWQANGHVYPGLKQMALDIFSIPLMTDDNERSFSSGRDMITYRRTRLSSDVIEACQCLKSWYQGEDKERKADGGSEVNGSAFDDEDVILNDLDASGARD